MVRKGTANGTAARSQAAEIDRLKRRLDRERLARREAEAIAERTTRGLYDEVAARTRELECIVDMGRELAQSLDDRGFADLIASHIARAVGFDECGSEMRGRPPLEERVLENLPYSDTRAYGVHTPEIHLAVYAITPPKSVAGAASARTLGSQ